MRTMRDSDFSMSTFPSSSSSVIESIMYSMRLTRFVCCMVGWHRTMRGLRRKEADKQINKPRHSHAIYQPPTSSSPTPPAAPIICPKPGSMPITFDMGPSFIT